MELLDKGLVPWRDTGCLVLATAAAAGAAGKCRRINDEMRVSTRYVINYIFRIIDLICDGPILEDNETKDLKLIKGYL